jgi:hypothetical protein
MLFSFQARLPEHTTQDPHYDPDVASEIQRVQSALSPLPGESIVHAVTRHLSALESILCFSVSLIYLFLYQTRIFNPTRPAIRQIATLQMR